MATYRFAQAGDKPGILALFTAAMIQELKDDFGSFTTPDPDANTGPNFRHVVGLDDSNVIRGYTRLEKVDSRWQIELTVADKSLTTNQRVTHFKLMCKHMASQVPANTVVFGVVKDGGRIDQVATPLGFNRKVIADGFVELSGTAAEIAARF